MASTLGNGELVRRGPRFGTDEDLQDGLDPSGEGWKAGKLGGSLNRSHAACL